MKLKFLLDTSVFCQPLRPRVVEPCQTRWERHGDDRLAVPAIAVAELEYGLFRKGSESLWSRYRAILKGRLEVLDFDSAVATTFGELKARQAESGRTVDDFDLAIAAIAVDRGLVLATLDKKHFGLIDGLKWEDWSLD